jgi:hypothetical protein
VCAIRYCRELENTKKLGFRTEIRTPDTELMNEHRPLSNKDHSKSMTMMIGDHLWNTNILQRM